MGSMIQRRPLDAGLLGAFLAENGVAGKLALDGLADEALVLLVGDGDGRCVGLGLGGNAVRANAPGVLSGGGGHAEGELKFRLQVHCFTTCAALHHEGNALQHGHVRQRIALHRDEIGELPVFDRAHAVRPADQVGGIHGGGLYGLQRRQPAACTMAANSWAFSPCG